MAYGLQIFDTLGRLELDSSETTNGGVFYGQIIIPGNGVINTSKEIIFDGVTSNSEISPSIFPDFKNRSMFLIISYLGAHEISSGLYIQDLYNRWPKINYRRPTNITQRDASTILVFIK